jgi:1,4-dihydroxy-2-naphthoyl-CoA hydrolase
MTLEEKTTLLLAQMKTLTLTQTLGLSFPELKPDRVVIEMPVSPVAMQPMGLLHGGISVYLAETAASFGGFLSAPEGYVPLGLEINANHIASVSSGVVRCMATPIHQGKGTQVWEARITQGDTLLSISRCTIAIKKAR